MRQEQDWMEALANHHARMRRAYPDDTLCIVFDIDGTIVDLRHQVVHVLLGYDRAHGTEFFHGLTAEHITASENDVQQILQDLAVPAPIRDDVTSWFNENIWSRESILAGHRPYRGVLGVIRWFQLQPATVVALNTGRPEELRGVTLESLERLGRDYRVRFDARLLYMNAHGWGKDVVRAKVEGLRLLRRDGMRVFAVVDNEPENIAAMAEYDVDGEILFLHAETIFTSRRVPTPRTVRGTSYELEGLVRQEDLVDRVQFVWHGVNDEANLRQFLASNVTWAEVDVRSDPYGRPVCRHDPFSDGTWSREEPPLSFADVLERLQQEGRSVKIDLKEDGQILLLVREIAQRMGMTPDRLWFNGAAETLRPSGFGLLSDEFPGAIVSCPGDFLAPLLLSDADMAGAVLTALRSWGINRLSISWANGSLSRILDALQASGWPVNVYDIPDLRAFLETALLVPDSITADFNFPEWHLFGRGSGAAGLRHAYGLERGMRVLPDSA